MLGVPLDQIHRLDIQDEKLVEVPDTPPDHPPEVKP
jgi:hypothetical protein